MPELDELVLEVVDLVVGAPPLVLLREALDALDQHAAVPGAVEDQDLAVARQVPPEAPQVVVRLLLVGRRRDRDDAVVARVERRASCGGSRRPCRPRPSPRRRSPRRSPSCAPCVRACAIASGARAAAPCRRRSASDRERSTEPSTVVAGSGSATGDGRRRRRRLRRRAVETRAQRGEDALGDGEIAILRIRAFDHLPRRGAAAGAAQEALGGGNHGVVALVDLAVELVHAQRGAVVLLRPLEPLLHLLLREMDPELQEQRAVVHERLLEALDVLGLARVVGIREPARQVIDDERRGPVADEERRDFPCAATRASSARNAAARAPRPTAAGTPASADSARPSTRAARSASR